MRLCSILGAQEGEDSFKRLGKICLVKNIYSKGERGFRYRGKKGHSKDKDVLSSLHLAFHEGKDLPDLRKSLSA